ncbi:hypothetical protein AB0A63_17320 [Lentzea sp. NPDC042327]|uniref:hypothetical protein n=1 Tax=Lentzea sp. NPDC042327 TaxID=3154801 RepID=UPI0033CC0946
MPEKYASSAKAVLMVLLLENREMANTEFTVQRKIKFGRADREALNRDKLIESSTDVTPYTHRITDEGIEWCITDLTESEMPARMGPQARALLEMVRRFVPFLRQKGLLAEAIRSRDLEDLIKQVYLELGDGYQDWVRLAKLRPRLDGAEREEVDQTLLKMVKDGSTHLVASANRKVLTDEDHAAAIRIGGEDKHLVAIEES